MGLSGTAMRPARTRNEWGKTRPPGSERPTMEIQTPRETNRSGTGRQLLPSPPARNQIPVFFGLVLGSLNVRDLQKGRLALLAMAAIAFCAILPAQQQPVPYSHKTHLGLGLTCKSCHRNPDPGDLMGFPAESFCMGCHRTVKADSPSIQRVAAAAQEKKGIPWVRVYQLPTFVYFSHRVHEKAGTSCETCHGPVRERDVLTKEVEHTMASCMACHASKQAPNECTSCHEERH